MKKIKSISAVTLTMISLIALTSCSKCQWKSPEPTYKTGTVLEEYIIGKRYLIKVDCDETIYVLSVGTPIIITKGESTIEALDFILSEGSIIKFQTNQAPFSNSSRFDQNNVGRLFPSHIKLKSKSGNEVK